MYDLSLHLLDIIENSIAADATMIDVLIIEQRKADKLFIEIQDNGRGMDREVQKKVLDPFFTTKSRKKTGLGLSLFAQAAEEGGGNLSIDSEVSEGTKITAVFKLGHIDRKPLGDMDETMRVLRATHPEITFRYKYEIRRV
jgi:signal transduction histidine kinase